ncbi:MAG: NAD(P)-dependent oxidoreductase [Chloroflexi bacterium]|nr:NAD(P)-dependent oxidoreductase [Chloroflexota bacterium]
MHILITGATGRVGSRFVPRLLQRGNAVRVLVRQVERAEFLRQQGAEVVVGDLLQPDTLARAVAGVEAVVHLAAFFRGATAEETQAVNQDGTLALAQAALQVGVSRFVFASTNLIYGPGRGRPAREDDIPEPTHAYPASKIAAEQALLDLHRTQGLGLRIMRLAFVYGEGDSHLADIVGWLRAWNPAKRLHMVHHADVAQALVLAIDTPGIDGRIYNVADDEPVPAAEILRFLNEPASQAAEAPPLDDPWEGIVDTARIRNELGFRPSYPSFQTARDAGAL